MESVPLGNIEFEADRFDQPIGQQHHGVLNDFTRANDHLCASEGVLADFRGTHVFHGRGMLGHGQDGDGGKG